MIQRTWRWQRFRQLRIVPQTPGLLAGGLFNLMIQGLGVAAMSSDGPPMLLTTRSSRPSLTRRRSICCSTNLQPQIKSSFKMGSLIGRGSSESFQLAVHGPDFVVVQPSEGQPIVASS